MNKQSISLENKLPLLMESKLFEDFTEAECKMVCSLLQPDLMDYAKNENIVNEGDLVDYFAIVCNGRVIKNKVGCDGNTHLIEILEKPKMFGIEIAASSSRISPITICSAEESSILRFQYDRILNQEFIPDKYRIKVLNNLINLMANDNVRKMYKIEVLSQKSLRIKILMHLHLMRDKTGKSSFSIGMDREQFAQYLCVNRSGLSHELGLMRKDGLISFKKDMFTVLDNANDYEAVE